MRASLAILLPCSIAQAQFAPTLDGQLERISAELPCQLDDDTWKATPSRHPPQRPPCPFTFANETPTRKLWRAALANAKSLRLDELAGHAAQPYLLTGVIVELSYDLLFRLNLSIAVGPIRVRAVAAQYLPEWKPGDAVEAVGYLADDGSLAIIELLQPGEVARVVAAWDRPPPPPAPRKRWFRRR